MDWNELVIESHFQTAVAIKDKIIEGNTNEAINGIEELIEALSRSDKRALKSQLIRLMVHIIKWKTQPEKRTSGWLSTIKNARIEIQDLLEDEPHLRNILPKIFNDLIPKALEIAEAEMSMTSEIKDLGWCEVFDDDYILTM